MIKNFETKARIAKSCPYCGSRKIATIAPKAFRKNTLQAVYIKCDRCGAKMHGYDDDGDFNTAYRQALTAWNRRAS